MPAGSGRCQIPVAWNETFLSNDWLSECSVSIGDDDKDFICSTIFYICIFELMGDECKKPGCKYMHRADVTKSLKSVDFEKVRLAAGKFFCHNYFGGGCMREERCPFMHDADMLRDVRQGRLRPPVKAQFCRHEFSSKRCEQTNCTFCHVGQLRMKAGVSHNPMGANPREDVQKAIQLWHDQKRNERNQEHARWRNQSGNDDNQWGKRQRRDTNYGQTDEKECDKTDGHGKSTTVLREADAVRRPFTSCRKADDEKPREDGGNTGNDRSGRKWRDVPVERASRSPLERDGKHASHKDKKTKRKDKSLVKAPKKEKKVSPSTVRDRSQRSRSSENRARSVADGERAADDAHWGSNSGGSASDSDSSAYERVYWTRRPEPQCLANLQDVAENYNDNGIWFHKMAMDWLMCNGRTVCNNQYTFGSMKVDCGKCRESTFVIDAGKISMLATVTLMFQKVKSLSPLIERAASKSLDTKEARALDEGWQSLYALTRGDVVKAIFEDHVRGRLFSGVDENDARGEFETKMKEEPTGIHRDGARQRRPRR